MDAISKFSVSLLTPKIEADSTSDTFYNFTILILRRTCFISSRKVKDAVDILFENIILARFNNCFDMVENFRHFQTLLESRIPQFQGITKIAELAT